MRNLRWLRTEAAAAARAGGLSHVLNCDAPAAAVAEEEAITTAAVAEEKAGGMDA